VPHYVYADPTVCRCVYAGTEQQYQDFKKLGREAQIARERSCPSRSSLIRSIRISGSRGGDGDGTPTDLGHRADQARASGSARGRWAASCGAAVTMRRRSKTIRTALDLGITLVDTAPVYGFGKSEDLVGRALAEHGGRARIVIATKAGLAWHAARSIGRFGSADPGGDRGLAATAADQLHRHLSGALARSSRAHRRTATALRRLFEQGTIRAIGVSNYARDQIEIFRTVAPVARRSAAVTTSSSGRSRRTSCRTPDVTASPCWRTERCGRGLLSGRMRRGTTFAGDDLRRPIQVPAASLRAVSRRLAALDRLARERYGKNVLVALAVRFVMDQGPTIALWGARRPEQLAPIGGALGGASTPRRARRSIASWRRPSRIRRPGVHGAASPRRGRSLLNEVRVIGDEGRRGHSH